MRSLDSIFTVAIALACEARNPRILYVAVSPFEYHRDDLEYVASYKRSL